MTDKQEIDLLLEELLAPRYTQAAPAKVTNEEVEIYHNGHDVGTPFVLHRDEPDEDDSDEDDDDDI
jgi:hypothetical protein